MSLDSVQNLISSSFSVFTQVMLFGLFFLISATIIIILRTRRKNFEKQKDDVGMKKIQGKSQSGEPFIKITDLNVFYNQGKSNEVRALENVNLEINRDEYVIIFGPSGCGKSTLLYSLAGLQKPTGGLIEVDGENIGGYDKKKTVAYHRQKIGLIFQAFYLIPSLSILDNVGLPRVFQNEEEEKIEKSSRKLLKRFSIADQAKKFPAALSGGQKQRVSIARSLINNPEIILADEPVGNLDSKSAYNVMEILSELNQKDKKTVILVTHDPSHIKYGNKIIRMKDGKIVEIEIIKKKIELAESYIFKEGHIKTELEEDGLIREKYVPNDLRQLMRAFESLSPSQIGAMLVPFKVEQLFSHIFFSVTSEQIILAKEILRDFLYSRISFDEFKNKLDLALEKSGAGWDKRVVESFSKKIDKILTVAKRVNFIEGEKTSFELAEYLVKNFELVIKEDKKKKLAGVIFDRLKNKIGITEMKKILDMNEEEGGLGLDKRTSGKISREIEILLLIRYSA
jgi:putative ABC transport system ATP-binding protein